MITGMIWGVPGSPLVLNSLSEDQKCQVGAGHKNPEALDLVKTAWSGTGRPRGLLVGMKSFRGLVGMGGLGSEVWSHFTQVSHKARVQGRPGSLGDT